MLFTSIWTIFPALTYLALAPRFLPLSANNKIIHLVMDAITALFWFAGFIALAAWYGSDNYCIERFCGVVVATCVFGAFEWYVVRRRCGLQKNCDLLTVVFLYRLLFTATTVLSALDWNRTRGNTSAAKTAPETTVV